MILTALLIKLLYPNSETFASSLMFGSAISATDPIAVIALLHSLGTNKKLATLIEGESLFNDGTSYVFFILFKDILTNTNYIYWFIIIFKIIMWCIYYW